MRLYLEKNSKVYKLILGSFCLSILFLFIPTLVNYQGNKIIYILFTILFNLLIFNIILRKTSFYEIFFGLLIWLGFWFKFSIFESNIYRFHSIFDGRALCDFNQNNFDLILVISSIGCMGFLLSILVSTFFHNKNLSTLLIDKLLIKKKTFFFLLFLILISYLIIILININFNFYQKGLLPSNTFFYLESIFLPYLYNVGFGAALCFIIYNLHILNQKNIYIILFLLCAEGFITNTSMLSRNMILYTSSIFLGYLLVLTNEKKSIKIKNFFFISVLFLVLTFLLSNFVTNKLRSSEYVMHENNRSTNKEYKCKISENEKFLRAPELFNLLLTRSIGIEGIITTYSNKKILGFDLIKKSLSETGLEKQSFYEEKFLAKQKRFKSYKNSNQVILPGIFGYLYYTGSGFFLFFGIFFISLIFIIYEKITIIFTRNTLFASFISFVVVWRLINFGYLVSNTINFIIAIIVTTLLIFFLQKSIIFNNHHKKL